MAAFSSPRALGSTAALIASLGSLAAALSVSGNPLATSDQRDLDALAIEIYQDNSFPVLKAEAKAAYKTAHGSPISDEASSSLDAAIEELIFSSVQKAVNNDPYYPKVYWVDAGPRDWFDLEVPGGRYSYDNPDCIYRTIPISSDVDYIVTGYRHTPGPTDVSFSLISDPNSQNTVAYLAGSDLVINSDGSYRITINNSAADAQSNHIQSTSSAVQLLIRNNLGDWQSEKPDNITVEAVSDVTGHDSITNAQILVDAKWNLQESIVDYGVGALGLKTSIYAVNTLSTPSQSSTLGTLTTQASSFGHFNLTDNEALVATLTPGAADYFVFPVTDPWLVTTDPARQVSLNSKQSIANDNGTYTFVVSVADPGVHNWINTTGLHEGTIMVRWQGLSSSSSDSVAIQAQTVALSDLASVLPSETRYVTAQERAVQLADRIAGYALRLEY
ncbi:hypothetical protein BO82DRAFT_316180 [Aspergillus uvarum CBS 121591]|uniref:DUF1214 domain-containing protein n=1 Tax=Aspergillus uvarum CBS 121591 TaxID=1448315 RepID=A0A319CU01_9EURO|nr:hypothetical protein BO82DRAFT_316180 [Aspergillus uvarum CBS 121591]PYH79078.1 hypothetical protein BO82DRAFT_316180 [Aspergillus uvarum CBS 121591]